MDDSILFCKATHEQAKAVQEVLRQYQEALRQQVNFEKSSVFFLERNTRREEKGHY